MYVCYYVDSVVFDVAILPEYVVDVYNAVYNCTYNYYVCMHVR